MNREEAEQLRRQARAKELEAQEILKRICVEHDQPIIRERLAAAGIVVGAISVGFQYDDTDPTTDIYTGLGTSYEAHKKIGAAIDGDGPDTLLMGWQIK